MQEIGLCTEKETVVYFKQKGLFVKEILFLTLLVSSTFAYDIDSSSASLQEKAYNTKVNSKPVISDEIKQRANALNSVIESRKADIETWKNKMDYKDGKLTFDKQVGNSNEVEQKDEDNGHFAEGERIYIFMSSSVPKETWIEYAKTIHAMRIGNRAVMILRGCIGGCEKILPTTNFITDVLTDEKKLKKGLGVQVWIDPLLFRKYNIKKVPAVVFASGLKTRKIELSEGIKENILAEPHINISYDDWELTHHIKELYKQTHNQTLRKLIAKSEKNDFYQK